MNNLVISNDSYYDIDTAGIYFFDLIKNDSIVKKYFINFDNVYQKYIKLLYLLRNNCKNYDRYISNLLFNKIISENNILKILQFNSLYDPFFSCYAMFNIGIDLDLLIATYNIEKTFYSEIDAYKYFKQMLCISMDKYKIKNKDDLIFFFFHMLFINKDTYTIQDIVNEYYLYFSYLLNDLYNNKKFIMPINDFSMIIKNKHKYKPILNNVFYFCPLTSSFEYFKL